MKKSFKKALTLILTLALVVSCFAACGNNNASPTQSGSNTTPTSKPSDPSPTKDPGATPTPTEALKSGYSEAPALAELVSAGKLPKVEDRLPVADDVYVERLDATGAQLKIGNYGGVINLGGAGGSWGLSRPTLESIIRYNTDGTYAPNVIKSYEYSSDYKVWTFHLREGMKWSDGEAFTADDITFWYYCCHLTNFDSKKSWKALIEKVNGEETFAVLKKIDDYTVTWTFQNPKYPADFIENGDFKWCWAPEHYLNDLIPNAGSYPAVENEYYKANTITDEQALANAKAKNIDAATVKDLGKAVAYNSWNIAGVPQVNSFVLCTTPGNSSKDDDLCIMERNKYYWKVDAEGNQLPYVDALHFNKTSEDDQQLLMFRSQQIDIIELAMDKIASTLSDMGDKAYLRTFSSTNWGSYQITFNYTNKNENYAKLFANKDFRQAMSICVNRSEVSELLSNGFLEPGQCAPAEGNFGYDADWEKKWTEYDVTKAKQLLEGCGLKMGSDGYYDFADGSDLVIEFLGYDGGYDTAYPVFEQYFKAVGINCAYKNLEVSAFDIEIDNNTWTAVIGPHTSIGGLSLKSRVAPFVPVSQAAEWYGEYGTYYEKNGEAGVKPEGDMAKLVEIYEKWNKEPDSAKRDEYALQIYAIHKDNLWSIAYLKAAGTYTLVNSKIQNYANNLVSDDLYQYANIVHYDVLFKAQ